MKIVIPKKGYEVVRSSAIDLSITGAYIIGRTWKLTFYPQQDVGFRIVRKK